MKKRIGIYILISGLIFLISGIAKSVDIAVFANTIASYGFENLQFLAPIIALAEIFIGFLLVFQIRLKITSFASVLLLIAFSAVYAYGLIFNGIEDCGCFGQITFLNTSPVFTFVRNAILIYMLVAVWRKAESSEKMSKAMVALMLLVIGTAAFMSGHGYRSVNKKKDKKYVVEAVKDTKLNDFIGTSEDSTYLIFAFTYTCPHCLNSIENLKQYEKIGIVDKVIGVALADSIAERRFNEIFKPDFSIKNYPKSEFLQLTNSFPVAYYIQNDSVVAQFSGELPCAYFFGEMLGNKNELAK